jgi:hypothetical protein
MIIKNLQICLIEVELIGGMVTEYGRVGTVYAYNPTTDVYGPVCYDGWNFLNVSVL